MTNATRYLAILAATALLACTGPTGVEQTRVTLDQKLPAADGAKLETRVVEVSYGPGSGSAPHSHSCAVVGHVTEGHLRTQLRGEPAHVYHAGESFYEAPNAIHEVSANASTREAVRFLAVFICDHAAPFTVSAGDAIAPVTALKEEPR
ncbi:MAG: cupin domain-containing protein [Gemmatimonadales bacterium]